MIHQKYSADNFIKLGLNSGPARRLAKELQAEVLARMHEIVLPSFQQVVTELNALGHDLRSYAVEAGDISYRDDVETDRGYQCKLRLGLDMVVSAGYAHLLKMDDEEIGDYGFLEDEIRRLENETDG